MINNNHLEQHGVHQSQIVNLYDIWRIISFRAISKEGKISSTAFKYNHKKTTHEAWFFFPFWGGGKLYKSQFVFLTLYVSDWIHSNHSYSGASSHINETNN